MDRIRKIIRFLHACHEADNRDTAIYNLKASKVQHLTFLRKGPEFLIGNLDVIPITHEQGKELHAAAQFNKTERTLIFAAHTLMGTLPKKPMRPSRLKAPLIFMPARVELKEHHAELVPDWAQMRLNIPVLQTVLDSVDANEDALDLLLDELPSGPDPNWDGLIFSQAMEQIIPSLDAGPFKVFPRQPEEKEIAAERRKSGASISLHSACWCALIPNSPDTRGVRSDLGQLANEPEFSRPLLELLGAAAQPPTTEQTPPRLLHVPAVLNASQETILQSAISHPVTVAVGPPGTGKSYTISALAAEHLSRGQNVLVVSQKQQALTVVADKIQSLVGSDQMILRGGRSSFRKELVNRLKDLRSGMIPQAFRDAEFITRDVRLELETQLCVIKLKLSKIEESFGKITNTALEWGELIEQERAGFFGDLVRRFQIWSKEKDLEDTAHLWAILDQYDTSTRELLVRMRAYLTRCIASQLKTLLSQERGHLRDFEKALRSRSSSRREQWYDGTGLEILRQTFPIWMCPLSSLRDLIPLKKDFFDVVIIDEASQCDIATTLPALHRAKRVVLCGDPKQLRHVSFLARDRMAKLARRQDLDAEDLDAFNYRERSILDVALDQVVEPDRKTLLDEHFRSHPHIIEFSNERFYRRSLKLMTGHPSKRNERAIFVHGVGGTRAKDGSNQKEAVEVLRTIIDIIDHEKEQPRDQRSSIGVISPFRAQVDLLQQTLQTRLPSDAITIHNLLIGTAHGFQGEERDIMLISFALDGDAPHMSLRFVERDDVFNVAITRARSQQRVFFSLNPDALSYESLLGSYLRHAIQRQSVVIPEGETDPFMQDVQRQLELNGCQCFRAWPHAGMEIDLLVQKHGNHLGIDLIGHPGRYAPAFDFERYRILQRSGMNLFPLPWYSWQKSKEGCLEAILNKLRW